jgi:PAS domain S-box-containing protein
MGIDSLIAYVLITLLIVSLLYQKSKLNQKDKDQNLIFSRINDAVICINSDWRYTFLNDAALATHPFGRDKIIGKLLWDVHPGLKGTAFGYIYIEAMSTGKFKEIENYYPEMDKWFLIKVYPSDTGLTIFYHDITERRVIKDRLITSEEKYRTLFFKSPAPMWLYDLENLSFIDVNDAAVNHYGYTRDEFLSMTIKDIRPSEEVDLLLQDIAQVKIVSDKSRHGKWRHLKKCGEIINVETTGYSFNHDDKTVRIIIVNDITQRVKAEQLLYENQMKLNEAQVIARISNWDVDLVKNLHTWSDEVYRILDLEPAETQPSLDLLLSLLHQRDKEFAQLLIRQALLDFNESEIEFKFTTGSGKTRFGYIKWRFGYDAANKPIRLFGILQDITDRKEAQRKSKSLAKKIREQKIQEQKKISRAIIKAQDKQRNYIAQELHDNINQILFGAKFHLGIAGRGDQNVKELIQPPLEMIDSAMHEIHLLCHNLAAPLRNSCLHEMIDKLISKQNKNSTAFPEINSSYVLPSELSDELKLNIYRIIQELLNNILKHAQAKNVSINIATKENCLLVTLKDDGKGFDIEKKREGLGLSNIMDRVTTFNGVVKLTSELGIGTKTEINIPLED